MAKDPFPNVISFTDIDERANVNFVIHFMMNTGINTINPRIFMDIILVLIDPVAIKINDYRIIPRIPPVQRIIFSVRLNSLLNGTYY